MTNNATFRKLAGQQNPRFGKRLGGEIYVASERSATLLQSYAPQSNFSALLHVSSPQTSLGLREYRCYPPLEFPCHRLAEAIRTPADRHQASHFRRISS
jgi:hypothetical protein